MDKLYRIWASMETFEGSVLHASEYPIVKVTPCGVWIQVYSTKKFVLANSRKRFAYPTLAEAKESFIARKRKYLQILEAKTSEAKRDIEIAIQQGVKIEICPGL